MNTIYQSIWNTRTGTFVAVSEQAKTGGKKVAGQSKRIVIMPVHFTLKSLTAAILLSAGFNVYALPVGGAVSAGSATIGTGAGTTTINQTSQNAVINWQSFNIGSGESVNFIQPNSSAIALNRVLGSDPSSILGSLNANGKVFLVNPNGIVFGQGASVNVGGLVGSTRNISDSDFMAGKYNFEGTGAGSIVNYGSINANGGSVALLGASVSNQGIIQARLGSVALAAGNSITLDVAGDGLLNVAVNKGAIDALVQNGGLIQADGGRVLMTAQSAGNLFPSTVNNTGVIRAQTIENRNGTIMLMGDMQSGTVNVAGTLDASAPTGGAGGFVETSAAHVNVASGSKITTLAPYGKTGTWLIDPVDFVISGTGNISGTTLSAQLLNNDVVITNIPGAGNGDIFVNDAVTWTPTPVPTTLTLSANRDVVVNAAITTTGGNLKLIAGRDVNQNAAITMTGGGVGGDLTMVGGRNVNVNGMFTVTNGNVLLAGANDGTGIGTVNFASGVLPSVTGPLSTVKIYYAPVSYATPTNFTGNFTLTGGATLTPFMWVFVQGDNKVYDGNNAATLSFQGNPALAGDVVLQPGTATFDSPDIGTGKPVNYSGYSLGGADANLFALFVPFDSLTAASGTPGAGITSASITPLGSIPPGSTPPGSIPPGSTPPGSTPPGSTPPGSTSPGSTPPGSTIPGLPAGSTASGLPTQVYPGAKTPDVSNSGDPATPFGNTTYLHNGGPDFSDPNLSLVPALTVVGTGINVPGNQLAQVTPIEPVPVRAPVQQRPYIAPVYLPRQERN